MSTYEHEKEELFKKFWENSMKTGKIDANEFRNMAKELNVKVTKDFVNEFFEYAEKHVFHAKITEVKIGEEGELIITVKGSKEEYRKKPKEIYM